MKRRTAHALAQSAWSTPLPANCSVTFCGGKLNTAARIVLRQCRETQASEDAQACAGPSGMVNQVKGKGAMDLYYVARTGREALANSN